MSTAETFLSEFDEEMKTTRNLLERVPIENAAWKPHVKSRAIGALASHIANLPVLGVLIATKPELDFTSPDLPKRPEFASRDDLLTAFDGLVTQARNEIGKLSDTDFAAPWTFRAGPQVLLNGSRAQALRRIVMSHLIHHRGQLSVYLRLNDVPLPSIYGPTADT